MNLFPMMAPAAPSQQTGGLFDNIKLALSDPAVKAGLLQAGMSMLNPNPNASPFSQIFTGAGEGIMAHQRYQDLETQRQVEATKLANEQAKADREFGLKAAFNKARIAKMATDAKVAQDNAASLAGYRAKKGMGTSGDKAADSAWRAFYRKKADPVVGQPPTPENVKAWRQEFDALESQRPGAGASPSGTATAAPDVDPAVAAGLPAGTPIDEIQAIADDEGIDLQTALQLWQQME